MPFIRKDTDTTEEYFPAFDGGSNSWRMNGRDDPILQAYPSFPIVAGIDGRHAGAFRRFRGFRRLDFDIREYSNSRFTTLAGDVTQGYDTLSGDRTAGAILRSGPHDWNGEPSQFSATSLTPTSAGSIPQSLSLDHIIDVQPIYISRPGTRIPAVGFAIHAVREDAAGVRRPIVKIMLRGIGDSSTGALYQVLVYYPLKRRDGAAADTNNTNLPGLEATLRPGIESSKVTARLTDPIDRIGSTTLGRFLFLSHQYLDTETGTIFNRHAEGFETALTHTLVHRSGYKMLDDSVTDLDVIFDGTRFLWPYVTGAKNHEGFLWHSTGGATPHSNASTVPGHPRIQVPATGVAAITAGVRIPVGSKLRWAARYVNKTTGFVGTMFNERTMQVADPARRNLVQWAENAAAGGIANLPTAAQIAADAGQPAPLVVTPFFGDWALMELFGFDRNRNIQLLKPTEDDIFIQFFRTLTTSTDNPAVGFGALFLDHEIKLTFQSDNISASDPRAFRIIPFRHEDDGAEGIPQLSDDALTSQEVFLPEFDIPGERHGSVTLGDCDGLLLSLDGSPAADLDEGDISAEDIRVSPPWADDYASRLGVVTPRFFHRVVPPAERPPSFMKVGSRAWFLNQNRMTSISRNGDAVFFLDVRDDGPTNREAACTSGNSLFIVTDSATLEINAQTGAAAPIAAIQRFIHTRWREYVRDGRIISGYDPQLQAVFIAPRAPLETGGWFRSECLVLWLTTNKVSLLYDCYWAAMTQGIHPTTGRRHLFFIDPAQNITYPDDSIADDSDQVSTMVGINRFDHPDLARAQATASIQILDGTACDSARFQIDTNIYSTLIGGTPTPTAVATALAAQITTAIGNSNGWCRIATAVASTDTVTLTAAILGIEGHNIPISASVDDTDVTITPFADGETTESHSSENHGGVKEGVIDGAPTDIGPGDFWRFTDPDILLTSKGTFDQYGWYDQWDATSATPTGSPRHSALRGAQVYFLRILTNADGLTRVVVIADGRIDASTTNTFDIPQSELNVRVDRNGDAYTFAANDQYSLSPVVTQIVSPPIATNTAQVFSTTTGSPTRLRAILENGAAVISRREGSAKTSHVSSPGKARQSEMFIGGVLSPELDDRPLGAPLVPDPSAEESRPIFKENDNGTLVAPRADNDLDGRWAECPIQGHGVHMVVSNYGSGANFDILALHVGSVLPTTPRGPDASSVADAGGS